MEKMTHIDWWKNQTNQICTKAVPKKKNSSLQPTYMFYTSLFKMPEEVAKTIESIQARFLWGSSELQKENQYD